jgi:hypothetical protein
VEKEGEMGKILCATRGGEASCRAQDAAIAKAKERGDGLVFLYVADLHFLDKTSGPVVVDIEGEMVKMGEFLLVMARERAAREGVAAGTVCHKGEIRGTVKRIAGEIGASLVVLGRPSGEESAFELAELRSFATEIESETGIEVEIV